jgi:hypothetical protein
MIVKWLLEIRAIFSNTFDIIVILQNFLPNFLTYKLMERKNTYF